MPSRCSACRPRSVGTLPGKCLPQLGHHTDSKGSAGTPHVATCALTLADATHQPPYAKLVCGTATTCITPPLSHAAAGGATMLLLATQAGLTRMDLSPYAQAASRALTCHTYLLRSGSSLLKVPYLPKGHANHWHYSRQPLCYASGLLAQHRVPCCTAATNA
jgi:hypothetical protein